jgi:hypothetical protein
LCRTISLKKTASYFCSVPCDTQGALEERLSHVVTVFNYIQAY